ncbi:T9SS type A sorting domain-containing protein [Subsaxibacter sp. CAU 1640]|uniref:T9SS type A sorting domain-containing protein n=1 Tax=Subsaxibacter sp. CAU 1640 TaxID=2933271 RepID=UPI0020058408|nr:T9SS type A sorting domain-containing protein [Subsaxibacter sp. CAU 1640]MCK7590663.1 T9SS type A sorting domain-containing protein [Subsaxibacter sp. CAU 1640]
MKKNYFLMAIFMMGLQLITAQTVINFDASSTAGTTTPPGWGGFMNVSNKPVDGGAYQFGSAWGVADLIAIVDTGANTLTLKPNRIGDTDPYWQTSGVLEGNKVMDATFYIQDDNLAATSFTFNGEVISNTLNSTGLSVPFVSTAFIKVFAADYSSFTAYTYDMSVGDFTIALDASQSTAGQHIQYGFEVVGVNINSDPSFDAAYDALGSIVVGPNMNLSVDEASESKFKIYPNPTNNHWNIVSNSNLIESITVYDVLGKQVATLIPNSLDASIDSKAFPKGVYIAKISTVTGSQSIRLVKN